MATTADGITSPNLGDEYNLTSALAFLGQTTQLALEKRGNTWRGTSAQRNAFTTSAPEGALWVDTNGQKPIWVKQGIVWKRVWPEEDTGWVTRLPLTTQTGWTIPTNTSANRFRRVGDWVYMTLTFARKTGTISVPASGDIVNSSIAILFPEWRPSTWQPLNSGESGRIASYSIGSNGHIRMNAVGGTANIVPNNHFSIRGWYRMDF